MQGRRSEGAERSGLCIDFQVRLKLAWQRFGEVDVEKEGFFSKYKKKQYVPRRQPMKGPWWMECCCCRMHQPLLPPKC